MAETWQVIRGGTTYTVSGGTYSYMVAAQGIGAPPKRNISVRGPFQHGVTFTDFRYDTRQIRLVYHFDKSTLSLADTNRDSIYNIWKGIEGEPVKLRVTRNNGTIFTIDCEVTGVIDMPNDMQDRIGTSQRFVVTLEAGDPFWYNHVTDTVIVDEDDTAWWLALGTVTLDNVLEYGELPTQGQLWTAADVTSGNPWTVIWETDLSSIPLSLRYGWQTSDSLWGTFNGQGLFVGSQSSAHVQTGKHIYIAVSDGSSRMLYIDNVFTGITVSGGGALTGTKRWRSGSAGSFLFDENLTYIGVYNIALSHDQRASLISAIGGATSSNLAAYKTIAYAGSWRAYPIVTINGPITDPVLTNVTTGDKLDFTGVTIDSGEYYVVDCRYGYKTVKDQAGTNKIAELTSDSDLAKFHLAPAGEVTNGNNAFMLTGTSTDSNTSVSIVYNKRYIGI